VAAPIGVFSIDLSGAGLTTHAGQNTQVPSAPSGVMFNSFSWTSDSGGSIAFVGTSDTPVRTGLYTQTRRIVDTTMSMPGGGLFNNINPGSLVGGTAAFTASDDTITRSLVFLDSGFPPALLADQNAIIPGTMRHF